MAQSLSLPQIEDLASQNVLGESIQNVSNNEHNDLARRTAFYSETIRRTVWSLTRGARTTVITRVLVDKLYPLLFLEPLRISSMSGQEMIDERRETIAALLEELQIIGDLTKLSKGRWLPSPLGAIDLDANRTLLIGGVPTALLNPEFRNMVHYSGHARHFQSSSFDIRNLELPSRTLHDWLGSETSEPLEEWTHRLLNPADFTPFEGEQDSIFLYYTDRSAKFIDPLQYSRWRPVRDSHNEDVYLARLELPYGPKEYFLAMVRKGRIQKTKPLGNVDHRRVMYGFDALTNHPTNVVLRRDRTFVSVELRNEIPRDIQRLFLACGVLLASETGKYYPRRWLFEDSSFKPIERTLANLRIKLQIEQDRRGENSC